MLSRITFALAAALVAAPAIAGPRDETAVAVAIDRPADPVVLVGSQVPTLQGAPPANVVAYRYSGGWVQVPVQVDERSVVDFGTIYHSTPLGVTALVYTDPNTWTGADSNPTLDPDDEVCFMARDTGDRVVAGMVAEPPGVVAGSGVEVTVTDPLAPSARGYVYLFRTAMAATQPAALVSYSFNLLSGDYKATYHLDNGPNPEDSGVSTSFYRHHFSDRWIDDQLKIGTSPAALDLVDRAKILFGPGDCRRSEDTFCGIALPGDADSEGAFIVNKRGPVRAIRSFLGANSGTLVERDHFFYERRHDVVTTLRVHPIPGVLDFFDYSAAATGMSYTVKLRSGLVQTTTIDGQPENVTAGDVEWEMVTGTAGTIIMANEVATDITGLGYTSFYEDDTTPATTQCTGDAAAYASSGPWITPGTLPKIPCTDPLRYMVDPACPSLFHLTASRYIYYDLPGTAVNVAYANTRRNQATTPVAATSVAWSLTPPTDSILVYVPSTGTWFERNSNSPGPADVAFSYGPGGAGVVALEGDWDGTGTDTPGIYDPATGAFFLRNSNAGGAADIVFSFGAGGMGLVPLAGDWDGNGTTTIGLYNPSTGTFFLKNSNAPGAADLAFSFGAGGPGLVPLTGDWDGNGTDTVGLYAPASGAFFLKNTNSNGAADLTVSYGPTNAVAVTGDWNGDGADTVGVYVGASSAWFLRNSNSPGPADIVFSYGPSGATPLTGNWDGQ